MNVVKMVLCIVLTCVYCSVLFVILYVCSNITCPFIDNAVINTELFLGLNYLSHLMVNSIIPLLEPLELDNEFYKTHPRFISRSNFVVVPDSSWDRARGDPWNSAVNLASGYESDEMMHSRQRRSTSTAGATTQMQILQVSLFVFNLFYPCHISERS